MAVVHKPPGPARAQEDRNEHVRIHVTEKVNGGFGKVGASFSLKTQYLLEEGISYMATRYQGDPGGAGLWAGTPGRRSWGPWP